MLLIPENDSLSHFSIVVLVDLYHKLTVPQRAQIFEIFLPEDAKLPKNNPLYLASMFPEITKQIIFLVSCLLGYQTNQWVDESIIGYLSIFSKENKPAFVYNYNSFMAENMHEKTMKITTEGMFKYSFVLVHMFLFQQGDMLPITLHKQDDQKINQSVTQWISLVKRNSTEFRFSDFIDCFIHPFAQLLNSQSEPRTGLEIKRVFHLSDQAKTGD